jgi:hypothetical protein
LFDPKATIVPTGQTQESLQKKAKKQNKPLPDDFKYDVVIKAGTSMFNLLRSCRAHAKGEKPPREYKMTNNRMAFVREEFPHWEKLIAQTEEDEFKEKEDEFKEKVEGFAADLKTYQELLNSEATIVPESQTQEILQKKAKQRQQQKILPDDFAYEAIIKAGTNMSVLLRTCRAHAKGEKYGKSLMADDRMAFVLEKLPSFQGLIEQGAKESRGSGKKAGSDPEQANYRPRIEAAEALSGMDRISTRRNNRPPRVVL